MMKKNSRGGVLKISFHADFKHGVFAVQKHPAKAVVTTAARGGPSPRCGSVEYTLPPKAEDAEGNRWD